MSNYFYHTISRVLHNQNMYIEETPSILYTILSNILSTIQGYNHQKYWRRRQALMSGHNLSSLKRVCYLFYIKRVDSKHLSSFGTGWNTGATFLTPPLLPHGPNGIIVGHDAIIGSNCKIFQQVTIMEGNVIIGNNVTIGAGAKILRNVTIGNNVKIGANAIVIEDIPDNATVVLQRPRVILK